MPSGAAVVSFVAGGRAWAVSPGNGRTITCLFDVSDPGVFSWGPRGDRVALSGLEVRGVGTSVSRPSAGVRAPYFSWSRPTGTTVIFTRGDRHTLLRADMGTPNTRDITPVAGKTYGDMAYHPSGLAIGLVTADGSGSQIWMSTNQGQNPVVVVGAQAGTTFPHLVFAHDGKGLYYSIEKQDGTHALGRYELASGAANPAVWTGDAPVADMVELGGMPGLALTLGAACESRRAVFSALDGSLDQRLDPGVSGPVSVVGRLDADRFVVAAGGCGKPQDLYVVHRSGAAPQLLVRSVDAAALRIPEPTPPPPLPANLPRSGFA
ncbi:MAG TPA: hypothetical protein VII47_07540 [Actinomycetota bacterium]